MQDKGIELSSSTKFPTRDGEEALPEDEPLSWAKSHVRNQNRCFAFIITALLIIATVYVLYLSEGSPLIENYESETGIKHEITTTANGIQHPKCNFQVHKDWLQTLVTKDDGVKYSIVDQITHDPSSFT
jgi:hypothetical protein